MKGNSGADLATEVLIMTTTNNSSYANANTVTGTMYATGSAMTASGYTLFDVTNLTTHKVRFYTSGMYSSNTIRSGAADAGGYTYFTFTRLAGT